MSKVINKKAIKEFLQQFFTDIRHWEISCLKRSKLCSENKMKYDEAARIDKKLYDDIFRKYCHQGLSKPRDLHFSDPPEYDPEDEIVDTIIKMADNIIEVRTKQKTRFQESFIYRIIEDEEKKYKIIKRLRINYEEKPVEYYI